MNTCITNGIKVSVSYKFEPEHSRTKDLRYVHSYTILIENKSNQTVQLLNRHWKIVDAEMNVREVKGDGVVGQQPILEPGESHQYSSWCPLPTDIGKMYGSFGMTSIKGDKFRVTVPAFVLCDSAKLN